MSWTGNPPERLTVKTEYARGEFVRQVTTAYSGGGMTVTEIRCTCHWPTDGCSLHGKMPQEPPA